MTAEECERIRRKWLREFEDLNRFGPPHKFSRRKLAGLYAVASILYHGNDVSQIHDDIFDSLCRWLLQNYNECVLAGADRLDKELLAACSGYDVHSFVKPYHDVAAILLGHACRCMYCGKQRAR